jgi:hypothetical protein
MLPQSSSMQRRRGGPESGGASFGSGPESGGGKFWQWTGKWWRQVLAVDRKVVEASVLYFQGRSTQVCNLVYVKRKSKMAIMENCVFWLTGFFFNRKPHNGRYF